MRLLETACISYCATSRVCQTDDLSVYVSVLGQLSQAQDAVTQELHSLDLATEHCLDQVNRTFQDVSALVERRRQEMVTAVGAACEEKRKVLEEQLALIEGEKNKVSYTELNNFLHFGSFSCRCLRSLSSDLPLNASKWSIFM